MLLATPRKYGPHASLLEFGFRHPIYDYVHPQLSVGWSNQIKVIYVLILNTAMC